MINVSEIQLQLVRLFEKQISLSEFSKWFVPHAWNAHLDSNHEAQQFAEMIDDLLMEFDGDSPELRQELLAAFVAFQHPALFVNQSDNPSFSPESNAEIESNLAVA